jgi:hypothetical protein
VSTLTFQFKNAWGAYQQQSVTFPITLSGTASYSVLSYPITGSGTVTQTSITSTQIVVTRVYNFTALVNGISVPQILIDVSYYDPTSYAYMGGMSTDYTLTTTNNVLLPGSMPPPDTLKCCSGGSLFYETSTTASGVPTHSFVLGVAADTANSVFVNLTDNTAAAANRSYRLDNTNTLTPVTENVNAVASVKTTSGTYPFNIAFTFHY